MKRELFTAPGGIISAPRLAHSGPPSNLSKVNKDETRCPLDNLAASGWAIPYHRKNEDEEAVAITLKDFQTFAQERMSEGVAHPEQLRDKVKEVLDFAVANESSIDPEANAYFNNFMDTVATC